MRIEVDTAEILALLHDVLKADRESLLAEVWPGIGEAINTAVAQAHDQPLPQMIPKP